MTKVGQTGNTGRRFPPAREFDDPTPRALLRFTSRQRDPYDASPSGRCGGNGCRPDGWIGPGRRWRPPGPHGPSVVSRRAVLFELRPPVRDAGGELPASCRRGAEDRGAEGAGRVVLAQWKLLPRDGCSTGPVGQGLRSRRQLDPGVLDRAVRLRLWAM